MTQANSISAAMEVTFGIPTIVSGIIIAIAAGAVMLGGLKRIAQVTELLVPFMAAFYIIGGIVILARNASQIPAAFGLIFRVLFQELLQ